MLNFKTSEDQRYSGLEIVIWVPCDVDAAEGLLLGCILCGLFPGLSCSVGKYELPDWEYEVRGDKPTCPSEVLDATAKIAKSIQVAVSEHRSDMLGLIQRGNPLPSPQQRRATAPTVPDREAN